MQLASQHKAFAHWALKRAGLRVQRLTTPTLAWDAFFDGLRGRGFVPANVIDVGVAWGTPPLYRAYPDAAYFLVEPQRQFEQSLTELQRTLDATVIRAAAGATESRMTIHVEKHGQVSSFFADQIVEKVDAYEVDVVRLDRVLTLRPGPVLMKVDVQGFELEVMRGCDGLLERLDVVILETSLMGSSLVPDFFDVVSFMRERGFVVYDFTGGTKRPLDQALWQVDVVFVPAGHALRAGCRWE